VTGIAAAGCASVASIKTIIVSRIVVIAFSIIELSCFGAPFIIDLVAHILRRGGLRIVPNIAATAPVHDSRNTFTALEQNP